MNELRTDTRSVNHKIAAAWDRAGTMPAKECVKVHPSDWHWMRGALVALCKERDALTALDRLSGRVTVKAKPLQWVDQWKNGTRFVADWGTPPICLTTDGSFYWGGGNYPTVDAAKAAAQADFETRILAALDTAPAPSPDQIKREALTLIERLYYIEGKDAEWRAARMNSVAREAQSPEPNLSRFHRIFPRSVFTGGDDE